MVLRLRNVVAALGLLVASGVSVPGSEPNLPEPGRLGVSAAATVSSNQHLADAVARQLRDSGRLQGYQLDIVVREGVVELVGQVASSEQHALALSLAAEVPGVARLVDHVAIQPLAALQRVQGIFQPNIIPGPTPRKDGKPEAANPATPPGPDVPVPPNASDGAAPDANAGGIQEPTPLFQATPPGPVPNAYYPPRMPPYAWPTYAPYNNFSRVGAPNLYPHNAFPFIGPMYPFPKVPLGWRSVNLTWQDGFWWYGRTSNGHDWWRVRYW